MIDIPLLNNLFISLLVELKNINLVPSPSFRRKWKAKKRSWNTEIFPNRGHIFQNKLRNTRTAIRLYPHG